MKSPIIRGALVLLVAGLCLAVGSLFLVRPPVLPEVKTVSRTVQSPDPIPWREPDADIKRFFPGASSHREVTRILSRERLTLIQKLGRQPTSEEHLVVSQDVMQGTRRVGSVLLRRVRGSGGAIELVVATAPDRRVLGVRLQRQREPKEVADLVTSPDWLRDFRGFHADSDWDGVRKRLVVKGAAETAASEIVEAVRSALIVFEVAESKGLPADADAHH